MNNVQLLAVFKELEKRISDIDIRQGGPVGPRGLTGPKGRKGERGATGSAGVNGKDGSQGAKGPQGLKGPQGPSGKDGLRGPQGLSGADGTKGADGLHGNHGRDGTDGVSITDVQIDIDGHLTVFLSDGTEVDAGVIDNKVGDTIVYTGGSGGSSGGEGGPTPPHNNLDGLQGTGPEYYHLNEAEWTVVIDWINNGIPPSALPDHNALNGLQGVGPEYIHLSQLEYDKLETGVVEGVTGTAPIAVDNTDPQNPIVSLTEPLDYVQGVTGTAPILVDNTDPFNPVVEFDSGVIPPPQTYLHADLTDITPNDHHDELHVLTSHTDVNAATPDDGERLAWDQPTGMWVPRRSTSALGIVAFNYRWTTPPNTLPPAGDVSTDNNDPALVTLIYINALNGSGDDLSIYFENMGEGDWINLIDRNDSSNTHSYDVLATPTEAGGVFTIPVVLFQTVGPQFSNNEQIAVFIRYTSSGVTSHLDLTDIGVNTHVQIDTHIADTSIHYPVGSIDHTLITNIGTNSHAQIDTHISNVSNPHGVTYAQIGGPWVYSGSNIHFSTGNVGVRTTALSDPFQVGTTATTRFAVRPDSNAVQLASYGSGVMEPLHFRANDYVFQTSDLPSGPADTRMVITDAGNVGIGVSDPAQRLVVQGAMVQQGASAALSMLDFGASIFITAGTPATPSTPGVPLAIQALGTITLDGTGGSGIVRLLSGGSEGLRVDSNVDVIIANGLVVGSSSPKVGSSFIEIPAPLASVTGQPNCITFFGSNNLTTAYGFGIDAFTMTRQALSHAWYEGSSVRQALLTTTGLTVDNLAGAGNRFVQADATGLMTATAPVNLQEISDRLDAIETQIVLLGGTI